MTITIRTSDYEKCIHFSYCPAYFALNCNRHSKQETCLRAMDYRFQQQEQAKQMLRNLEGVIQTSREAEK